jgi:hypothetical protein
MRLGGIGTRYAVWIAALNLALLSTALGAAGFLAFRESRVVQSEIHAAVSTARTSDEEEALRKTATYLGASSTSSASTIRSGRSGPGCR